MVARRAHSRILVVDDEPDVVGPLVRALSIAGYHVDGAGSAQEARELVARGTYALAYVDVFLGRDDGEALAAELRGHGIRVTLISGLPLRQLGAEWEPDVRFLAKPVEPGALIAETDHALGVGGNGAP